MKYTYSTCLNADSTMRIAESSSVLHRSLKNELGMSGISFISMRHVAKCRANHCSEPRGFCGKRGRWACEKEGGGNASFLALLAMLWLSKRVSPPSALHPPATPVPRLVENILNSSRAPLQRVHDQQPPTMQPNKKLLTFMNYMLQELFLRIIQG